MYNSKVTKVTRWGRVTTHTVLQYRNRNEKVNQYCMPASQINTKPCLAESLACQISEMLQYKECLAIPSILKRYLPKGTQKKSCLHFMPRTFPMLYKYISELQAFFKCSENG